MNDTEAELVGPADDGLPDVADDDSWADDVHEEAARDSGARWPGLPDREDGPLALDDYGTTAAERFRGEPLSRRLAREQPEVLDGDTWLDPDLHLADDGDPEAVDQLDEDSEALADDDLIDPRLGSAVSVFDRPVPGVPSHHGIGRLVRPGGAYVSNEVDEFAYDLGLSAGGFSGEELAMHEVPPGAPDEDSSAQPPP